ncbi:hypothetical protein [Streptomyces noursei]|uniref:Uncharacterized protein n=1 Tax=Streptomyces noursei TaxID=1971 RepID=A0A2N8P7U3_STRNR|nr:hypothetical protein [Streptomyces noursei]PNE37085.1 hypothetical protein AOB60_22015 [Streptomyces noursei]
MDLYRDAATTAGHTLRIATSLPLVVANTDTQAEHLADRHIARHLEVWREAMESWNGHESGEYPDNGRKTVPHPPRLPARDRTGGVRAHQKALSRRRRPMSHTAVLSLDLEGVEAADFEVVEANEYSSALMPATGPLPGGADGRLRVRRGDNRPGDYR